MKLEITKASEVQVKSVEWLWYPYDLCMRNLCHLRQS